LDLGAFRWRLQDPGNLGTIIRTATAVGVNGLWISANSVDPTHPKVLRASAGQWFRLPIYSGVNLVETITEIQQTIGSTPLQVLATTPNAERSYWDIDYTKPSLLLVGNEGTGLSAELMHLAKEQVQIPSSPAVESLNVAIATAIVLYEAKRQRCH
ncbi:MAG: RNA methyltransferase, partial [Merismopedia sp. SIO2A8]|nr:RNA methyltransferase [Merismopedia sp. SIO2A8]